MRKQTKVERAACQFCGTYFEASEKVKICPLCNEEILAYEREIKEYMKDIPRITSAELSAELDIPMSVIDYLIEDDFFNVLESIVEFTPTRRCKRCGQQIPTGKFCPECLSMIIAEEVKNDGAVAHLKEEAAQGTQKFHITADRKSIHSRRKINSGNNP